MANRVAKEKALIEYWLRRGFIKEDGENYIITERGKQQREAEDARR